MHEPDTFWLTVTNVVLGAVVLLCVLGAVVCALRDVISRWRRRRSASAELDRDMRRYFGRPKLKRKRP